MHDTRYTIRGAASDRDLSGILALQAANLPDQLDANERVSQGFVTLRHDLPLLREMNEPWSHLVATPTGSGEIVGYALVMLRDFRDRFPLLAPMFERLDRLGNQGRPLEDVRWYIMGQVCVARAHRGRGLVERLYEGHRSQMSADFDLMITEIDRANQRSVRAHEKAGFEVIDEYRSDGHDWVVVALDLRSHA